MKELYAIQPYQVGSKNAKSLALIIPAKVTREYNINTSTVFALRTDKDTKRIRLRNMDETIQECKGDIVVTPAGQSLEPSSQPT